MVTVPALSDEAAINQYVASSAQTDFNFTYMIFATADIKVYVDGVLKTEITDYNVRKSTGASIASSDLPLDGGKVVFTSGVTLDAEVTLSRSIAVARLTGYSVAGAFRADVLNAELTKLVAICQELKRDSARAITLSAYDSEGGSLVIPSGRAGNFLAFDASGNMITAAGTTETTVSTFAATLLDDATASAARDTLGALAYVAPARGSLFYGNSSAAWAALAKGTANQYLRSDGTDLSWVTPTLPTIQKFTSGSGTYTTPAGVRYIRVKQVGAGGGGGGSGAGGGIGGTGGDSTFGTSLLVANGGTGGATNGALGGSGGTASLGTGPIGTALSGGYGQAGVTTSVAGTNPCGGYGAASALGGAGSGANGSGGSVGGAGTSNTGGGGGGAGCGAGATFAGAGGGAGGYIDAIIVNPSATYAYSVGVAGAGGSAGTSGFVGGSGASGYIEITEFYH